MKLAIEMFTTMIAVTLSCILFSSFISLSDQKYAAREFYGLVTGRIENSGGEEELITQCMEEAKKRGYEISIEEATVHKEHPSKLVTMTYDVIFPMLALFGEGYTHQEKIQGYASYVIAAD